MLPEDIPILNIDHHTSNNFFGTVNWTEDAISSAGEMLYNMLKMSGAPISKVMAEALYVAIITDTGRLSYSNTSPSTLDACADLMRLGADCPKIAKNLFECSSITRLRLLSKSLTTLETSPDGNISWMVVTREMYKSSGASYQDTYEFVDYAKSVAGARLAILLRDHDPDGVKISVRSDGYVNAHRLCSAFGGGGHECAAGAVLVTNLDEAKTKVFSIVKRMLEHPGR
jgi:phosphoesterase RecJ-like protein